MSSRQLYHPHKKNLVRSLIAPSSTTASYDKWFAFAVVTLVLFGLVMLASASIVISEKKMSMPFYFLYRQCAHLILGIFLGCVIVQINTSYWERMGGYLLLIVMLMLTLVLIPGIGHTVNGSARWLGVGPVALQVSDLAKYAMVIYMAGYLVRRHQEVQTQFSGFLKPMAILAIVALLLLREPDFGATVVIVATSLGMMFLAGMRLRHFFIIVLVAIIALSILAISAPYRMQRLTSFVNPWANPFDSGYQLTQSLIAFGRGGLSGVGLGKSIQKLFYLPEAHTDFLFAVIVEELGLLGAVLVIGLFALLVMRILFIGRSALERNHAFSGFLAYGFGLWLAIQFIVSIGVNAGLLPTKGLTLPLMSYGGSSMLVNCAVVALLLRIDHENRA